VRAPLLVACLLAHSIPRSRAILAFRGYAVVLNKARGNPNASAQDRAEVHRLLTIQQHQMHLLNAIQLQIQTHDHCTTYNLPFDPRPLQGMVASLQSQLTTLLAQLHAQQQPATSSRTNPSTPTGAPAPAPEQLQEAEVHGRCSSLSESTTTTTTSTGGNTSSSRSSSSASSSRTLLVSNLPLKSTHEELFSIFAQFGEIVACELKPAVPADVLQALQSAGAGAGTDEVRTSGDRAGDVLFRMTDSHAYVYIRTHTHTSIPLLSQKLNEKLSAYHGAMRAVLEFATEASAKRACSLNGLGLVDPNNEVATLFLAVEPME
jgi:hypothetical protein